ncbi:YshB family small membrane protein [Apirhabdus apintestini]|nr:YshB family small membrane protein [Erwinia sp. HR93]MEA1062858.1 YshB family small membrane protein [Erwinia sp. HR93]WPM84756.1 YshB family small membrane protein [Enterobacteriaceae bacterium CA-0114]
MLESLIHLAAGGADVGAAAGHSPQAAIAALLCAALVNFFS